jgi:hypothetical protein
MNYADGHCARCVLRARIAVLAQAGDPAAVKALQGYLAALTERHNAFSTLNWMTCGRGSETLRELISGIVPLTHEALDTVDRGLSTVYLRAALVSHGALPQRQAQTAALAAFIDRELSRVPAGTDRLHLQTFATWKVQHELSISERRGTARHSANQQARPKIRVAADLLLWLSQHKLALKDLRQEHLDYWLSEGSSQRRRLRAFIVWAVRQKITGPLTVIPAATRRHVDPLETPERVQLLRALLTNDALDLRDRVAGSLVLLFAQRISRLVLITRDEVQQCDGEVFLSLGREPLLLPELLGILTQRLKEAPPGAATTTNNTSSGWLFPGRLLDTHLSEHHLRERLHKLNVKSLPARNSAVLGLGQTLPAAILADLLGVAENTAERWTQLANGDWTRYAAARTQQQTPEGA